MRYQIVTSRQTVIGTPFTSYEQAFNAAVALFGDGIEEWIARNLRIEQAPVRKPH